MQVRQNFLIHCLSIADLNITQVLKNLSGQLERAEAAFEQTQEPDFYFDSIQLRQNVVTLEAFKILLEKGLCALQEKPGILSGLTPLFMLIYDRLPVEQAILTRLQENFIRIISLDKYIAKKYESTLTRFLLDEYEKIESDLFTAAYIQKEKQTLRAKLWVCRRVFSEVLFNNSRTLTQLVVDDANILQKQMGQAFTYREHRYMSGSQPQSKMQLRADLAHSSAEPIQQLQLALVLPWPESQIGQTCKLHAFHAAAWVLHLLRPYTTPCPPPVHALPGMSEEKKSLVEQAKKLFYSTIGEVYSPAYLLSLMNENGYRNVCLFQCESGNYIKQLKWVIDRGGLALIYFDVAVDPRQFEKNGFPCKKNGNYEHSAVVCGYSTTESGKNYFYIYQWNGYYRFDADDLLASTGQLERRRGEVFYDLALEGEPRWFDLHRINEFEPDLAEKIKKKEYRGKLFAPPPPNNLPSFRNCIIGFGPNLGYRSEKATELKSKQAPH